MLHPSNKFHILKDKYPPHNQGDVILMWGGGVNCESTLIHSYQEKLLHVVGRKRTTFKYIITKTLMFVCHCKQKICHKINILSEGQ